MRGIYPFTRINLVLMLMLMLKKAFSRRCKLHRDKES